MDLNISYNVPSSYRNLSTNQFMYIPSDFYTLAMYVQLPNCLDVFRPLPSFLLLQIAGGALQPQRVIFYLVTFLMSCNGLPGLFPHHAPCDLHDINVRLQHHLWCGKWNKRPVGPQNNFIESDIYKCGNQRLIDRVDPRLVWSLF